MFIEKSSTEVITIDKEIKVVGLSLQKSNLPISFDSLGKLWGLYGDTYRGKVKNAIEAIENQNVEMYTLTPIKV